VARLPQTSTESVRTRQSPPDPPPPPLTRRGAGFLIGLAMDMDRVNQHIEAAQRAADEAAAMLAGAQARLIMARSLGVSLPRAEAMCKEARQLADGACSELGRAEGVL